uniref:Vesicular, overexpressed in cancer, prosurvival protein 1 n=1 Tax=Poecilia latipinna TaxID=48699 RepID=A0A3B3V500_9TELE
MMGVLFCCGAGFFIRRRMYPSPLRDEPTFNVSFTRQSVTSPGKAGSSQNQAHFIRVNSLPPPQNHRFPPKQQKPSHFRTIYSPHV